MFKYKFENSILPDETVHGSREFLRSKDIQVRSFTLPEFRARGGIPISIHRLLSLPSAIYIRPAETRPSFAFLRTRGSASQKSRREEEEEGGGRRKFPSFHRWPARSERDRSAISRGRGQISPDNNTSLLQQFQQLGRAQLQVYVSSLASDARGGEGRVNERRRDADAHGSTEIGTFYLVAWRKTWRKPSSRTSDDALFTDPPEINPILDEIDPPYSLNFHISSLILIISLHFPKKE